MINYNPRWVYTFLLWLLLPYTFFHLQWRARKQPEYLKHIGERFGFPGCAAVLLLYCVLVWKCLQVARRTREPYGRLVCVGVITLIAVQTLLNTGMTVGLLPITGTTLPLCSYGGSSLISTYTGIGLVMNIAMRQGYEVTGEPFMFRRETTRS